MVTEYYKQAYNPQSTITETLKLAYSTKFAGRSHMVAESSGDCLDTGFPCNHSHK